MIGIIEYLIATIRFQEVTQSVRTTLNETEVISSNFSLFLILTCR
jgi:hypothetical protein